MRDPGNEQLDALAWRGDHHAIRRYFERAIDLGTTNAKVYFDYALMIEEKGAPVDRVDSLLRKAAEIQPDLADAHLMLGFRALHTERYQAALEHFGRIREVVPERSSSMYGPWPMPTIAWGIRKRPLNLPGWRARWPAPPRRSVKRIS